MENCKEKNEIVEGITVEQALKKYEPMVNRFVNSVHTNHVCSKEDLIQEGRMAIVVAFNYFDEEKGASLTTWTYHMIKDAIIEYQKHHLSVLSGGAYLQNVLRKAGQDASVEEIMEFGVSKKTALASIYMKNSFSTVDYDELESLIEGKPFEEVSTFLDWEKYLTKEEAFAIGSYFGFGDQKRLTKTEIGNVLGKSRKAASDIINKALVKLRKIPGIEEYAYR